MINKKLSYLLISLILTSTLFAQNSLNRVSVQLNWKHSFEFAGFYMAKEKGFYIDDGLDVELKELKPNTNVVEDVLDGVSTFGIGYPTLILDRANGKDIILLAAILQSSPHVLVSLKNSSIESFKDFAGKKIMIGDDAAKSASFLSMFLSNNVRFEDMVQIKHSFNIYDLILRKVDIFSCYVSDEIFTLKSANLEYNIWDPKDYGFDFYDGIIFTSKSFLKKEPKVVEKFVDSTIKGWIYAFEHIDETIEVILRKYNTQSKSREALEYEAATLKELAFFGTKNFGEIAKGKIQRIYDIYHFMGLTKNRIDFDDFIYRNYQSKEALTSKELEYLKKKGEIKVCTNPN